MAVSSYLPKFSLPGKPNGVCQASEVMAFLQRKQSSADCCVSTRGCTKWGMAAGPGRGKPPAPPVSQGGNSKKAMTVLILIFAQGYPSEGAKQQSACYPWHLRQLKATLRCDKAVGTLADISALLFKPIASWQSAWT